jgi:hypothetical protein
VVAIKHEVMITNAEQENQTVLTTVLLCAHSYGHCDRHSKLEWNMVKKKNRVKLSL